MTNIKLRAYVRSLQGEYATCFSTLVIKNPVILCLYRDYYGIPQHERVLNYTCISVEAYNNFLWWVEERTTAEDCLAAGFTEHEVIELLSDEQTV